MKTKIIFIILFAVVSIFAYAEESLNGIIKVMVDNIKVENSRCITIPGDKGVLRIYMESKNISPHSIEYLVIDYNGNQTSFQAGSNFLITQDDKLVFGKHKDRVYAKINDNTYKEQLKIKHNNILYDYTSNNIKITVDGNKFTAEEVLYDRSSEKFVVYSNGMAVKQIEVGTQ